MFLVASSHLILCQDITMFECFQGDPLHCRDNLCALSIGNGMKMNHISPNEYCYCSPVGFNPLRNTKLSNNALTLQFIDYYGTSWGNHIFLL